MCTFVGSYSAALVMQLVWFKKILVGALKVIGLLEDKKSD